MRYPSQQYIFSFMFFFRVLIGVSIGQVALASSDELGAEQTPPEAVLLTGAQVYNAVCIACHGAPGVGGAPAFGDNDAWAERISHGIDTLIDHALNGYSGSTGIMPKKGGRVDLSDEEIIGAVEYLVDQLTL